jgi:tRNA uracil 4-sulfurtransferase
MKENTFLVHYDELSLKGGNRSYFEKTLIENIKKQAKNKGISLNADNLWGRILISSQAKSSDISIVLKKVTGIAWYANCKIVVADSEKIKKAIDKIALKKSFSTFAIRVKVANKDFFLKRKDLEIELGSYVVEKYQKKVDLEKPNLIFFIEVYSLKKVFIYSKKRNGLGGLPLKTAGKGLALISGGIDSPVASFLMFSRGLSLDFVHFHSYPKTGQESIEKTKKLVELLSTFQPNTNLHLVPILPIQEQIYLNCNHKYLVILYRRVMLKIGQIIAEKNNLNCLVTGDALSQVASQTIENLTVQNNSVSLPIFRPIISFNKEQVIKIAKEIKTYPVSIQPHSDCCSLFVPKHPVTKTKIKDIIREETKLDFDKLIKKAMEKTETISFPVKTK